MESNLLVGQLTIHGSISVRASLYIGLIASIKVHLDNSASVNLATSAFAGDFRGVDDILENGILDRCERTGAGAQSRGLLGAGVALTQNVTLGDDNDVTSGELFLQFANETGLDLLDGLLEFVRHVDDDSLKTRTTVHLFGCSDV